MEELYGVKTKALAERRAATSPGDGLPSESACKPIRNGYSTARPAHAMLGHRTCYNHMRWQRRKEHG